MRVTIVGAGPAGLYLSILLKLADADHRVVVLERNRHDDTFGFGVVVSDATMGNLAAADPETHRAITDSFWHWDEIDTFVGGERLRSSGHGFAGMSRHKLLLLLQERARGLGVELCFEHEVGDPADLEKDCDLLVQVSRHTDLHGGQTGHVEQHRRFEQVDEVARQLLRRHGLTISLIDEKIARIRGAFRHGTHPGPEQADHRNERQQDHREHGIDEAHSDFSP
jgi:glycine/D-amino acid oxidase-like deaminating enzyme